MEAAAAHKAQYYAFKAAELTALSESLTEPARKDMLVVVAEYQKLSSHWASIARMETLTHSG